MSKPNAFTKVYYQKLVGYCIADIRWRNLEGRPLPVLVLRDAAGNEQFPVFVEVLADPEGNGPGHLAHDL